jgi:hypothetical protein
MKEYYSNIHGIGVGIHVYDASLEECPRSLLAHFNCPSLPSPPALELHLLSASSLQNATLDLPASAELVYSRSKLLAGQVHDDEIDIDIYRVTDQLHVDLHHMGRLMVDVRKGRAEAVFLQPEKIHPDLIRCYVLFMLVELLKREELYMLHATAVEKNGRGVLIVGSSGHGKTTACISLLRGGYSFMADDHPFLRDSGCDLEMLSFPEKIDVTQATVDLFPELREAQSSLRQGYRKMYFHPSEIFPQQPVERSIPALLLFPQVAESAESSLEKIPGSRALELLLPQSMLVFSKKVARAQFQVLSRLAAEAECYQLNFGRDVLALPQLLEGLMVGA